MLRATMPPQAVSSVSTSGNGATQISFDDMAKFFKLPIAEASYQLGVCSSTLKRICRDNGIPRWPYRKIMAGKSIEDIRREAAEDIKAKLAAEKQSGQLSDPHYMLASAPTMAQAIPDRQFGSWTGVSSASQLPVNPIPAHRDHVAMASTATSLAHKPKVSFPSFLDEFRNGFPSSGLSRTSYRWWGSKEADVVSSNVGETETRAASGSEQSTDGGGSTVGNGSDEANPGAGSAETKEETPSSILARKRKRCAEIGRRASRLAVVRGYSAQPPGEKDKELLKSIFGEYLPKQWHASFGP